jgi:hypothetical protein
MRTSEDGAEILVLARPGRREDSRSLAQDFVDELLVTKQEQIHSDRLVREVARAPDQRANVLCR